MSEIDRYINFDQTIVPSPPKTPSPLASKSTSIPAQEFSASSFLPLQPSSQQTFAAPSHQYGLYQQHNGLPVGALAVTQTGQNYMGGQQHYANTIDSGLGLEGPEDVEFGGYGESYNAGLDVDMDFNVPPYNALQSLDADFVDPAAIGGQEDSTHPQPPMRAYPGIHQEQAALAKAQAEAQKQKQREATAQQQKPVSQGRDPVVEDRISRLLNQMRHSSVASSNEDDTTTQNPSGASGSSRAKKDEEDMDEDERLLASEEGKKLSSKERRQLRNKVSARAFRSRRKEYIGQLEGEIAQKSTENDELRAKNQELMKENAQLHELTRTLLSSSAFSEFLNEVGGMPSAPTKSATPVPPKSSAVKVEQPVPSVPKDVNPNRAASHQAQNQQSDQPYIGMTMIPEQQIDYTAFDNNMNSWNGMGSYDMHVFAVTSLPESPVIDGLELGHLSDKSSNTLVDSWSLDTRKADSPQKIEPMPDVTQFSQAAESETDDASDAEPFDESDPDFALFADGSTSTERTASPVNEPIFGEIQLEKAFGRVELILEEETASGEVGPAAIERFQRVCATLEALSERVTAAIPF